MSDKPDDLNDQIRNTINETISSLVAVGCSHETACGLLVVQGMIRMRDREKIAELRDFLDSCTEVGDDDEGD
ncbi:hypothetical protein [Bradyrhizobium sp. LVM 105]|uniref:hypothetical protein n=1 Tax=Bradyrhizobium sp. LVM 105 TaxID=2341115 RepID=UPI000F80102E|nr:hypothetical protein [Bradyrhizobium sp. LVM 105]RTE92444.1 hypothetical protein D6B98_13015 [Bradyrhizobium sp. LVM 105]